MPRNGSGEYDLPYNWNDDKANGIKVLASRMQSQDQDIANALTGSLSSDGQTPLTGDLDFNGNRAVDLDDGQDTQDAVVVGQAQTGELQYYGISSTVPLGTDGLNYEVNANPTLLEYVDGLEFNFVAHYTCIADPKLRVDTLSQKDFVKNDGAGGYTNLIIGDIAADHSYNCYYNSSVASGKILVKNPEKPATNTSNMSQATETARGVAEITTQAETDAITDDLRIVTPKKLGNGFAISLGANGYIKLPSWLSGFTIMWGRTSFASGSGQRTFTITFPAIFTNAVYTIVGNNCGGFDGLIVEFQVPTTSSVSTSVVQRQANSFNASAVSWIAMGY